MVVVDKQYADLGRKSVSLLQWLDVRLLTVVWNQLVIFPNSFWHKLSLHST